ncbi:hypothetical protein AGR56_05185 [Clostridium sp. DMHC 10]|uniref:hypothetical protein n=1 Tax=Clostridium sp. DMHC 10 TaxID=747377 RepID=UPI00069EC7B6|nr:hypothetical protein [Clostridium sp. DMHC 10]KOF56259.1 hypothetical protein AGR56_05185 [Clostridium sp. DMHC 10]
MKNRFNIFFINNKKLDKNFAVVTYYFKNAAIPVSAHTLLPKAITKTLTNTMKIQYDFTCDYVYPLDMPAH